MQQCSVGMSIEELMSMKDIGTFDDKNFIASMRESAPSTSKLMSQIHGSCKSITRSEDIEDIIESENICDYQELMHYLREHNASYAARLVRAEPNHFVAFISARNARIEQRERERELIGMYPVSEAPVSTPTSSDVSGSAEEVVKASVDAEMSTETSEIVSSAETLSEEASCDESLSDDTEKTPDADAPVSSTAPVADNEPVTLAGIDPLLIAKAIAYGVQTGFAEIEGVRMDAFERSVSVTEAIGTTLLARESALAGIISEYVRALDANTLMLATLCENLTGVAVELPRREVAGATSDESDTGDTGDGDGVKTGVVSDEGGVSETGEGGTTGEGSSGSNGGHEHPYQADARELEREVDDVCSEGIDTDDGHEEVDVMEAAGVSDEAGAKDMIGRVPVETTLSEPNESDELNESDAFVPCNDDELEM